MLRRPNKRGHSYPPTAPRSLPADDGLVAYDSSVPLSPTASLVTRMQAIHGLAKRRPERPRAGPSSFFRDEPPKARDRGPSANRERLRNVHPIDTGQGAMAAAGPSFGRAQSPTSLYGYTDALLASTSSLASPLGGPQQTLYQMPSPGSDASSSSSSKSPLWPQQNFEYPLREDMAVGYGPQASSSLSPQLNTLSSANSSNGARSLGTSSLTDTGLIASYPSSSFNFPSSWLGPPPVSVGGYTTSVPYGVPTSSSSSTGSRQSPQMLPHYPTGGMPPSISVLERAANDRSRPRRRHANSNIIRIGRAWRRRTRRVSLRSQMRSRRSLRAPVRGRRARAGPVPGPSVCPPSPRLRGLSSTATRHFYSTPSQRRKIQSDCSRPSGRWTTRITIRAWQR